MSKVKVIKYPSPTVELFTKNSTPWFKVVKPWSVTLTVDGCIRQIECEEGFTSDGGTIPRVTGFMRGLAMRCYIIHDWLYTNHQFDRETSDEILKALLLAEGVDDEDALIIYGAVRVGGESHWSQP